MSIATKKGDGGQTSLPGGRRVSKSDLRVEAYGSIDELISFLGFARSICEDEEMNKLCKQVQRELFLVSSAVATPPGREVPEVAAATVEALTAEIHKMEKIDGILADWSIPGEHPVSSAFDLARAVCRRAERNVIRLRDSGEQISDTVLSYLNRLSDFLWIAGRAIEVRAGLDASLRQKTNKGKRWSRAW